MNKHLFANLAKAEIGSPVDPLDTTIILQNASDSLLSELAQTEQGSVFNRVVVLTIFDDEQVERVLVVGWDPVGNEATVERGHDGSAALSWSEGNGVELRLTADVLRSLRQFEEDPQTDLGFGQLDLQVERGDAPATGYRSVAIGSTKIESPAGSSVAVGANTVKATGYRAVCLAGTFSEASAYSSVCLASGYSYARGNQSLAAGGWSIIADGMNSVAVGGGGIHADEMYSVAIGGYSCKALKVNSVALGGSYANASEEDSVAIGGSNIYADGLRSIAIGSGARAKGDGVAIGYQSAAEDAYQVSFPVNEIVGEPLFLGTSVRAMHAVTEDTAATADLAPGATIRGAPGLVAIRGIVAARTLNATGAIQAAYWSIDAMAIREDAGANAILVDGTATMLGSQGTEAAGWSVTPGVSGNSFILSVEQDATTPKVGWSARLSTVDMQSEGLV